MHKIVKSCFFEQLGKVVSLNNLAKLFKDKKNRHKILIPGIKNGVRATCSTDV